jgi:hypothetical protein
MHANAPATNRRTGEVTGSSGGLAGGGATHTSADPHPLLARATGR